jgi:hypothetical protein
MGRTLDLDAAMNLLASSDLTQQLASQLRQRQAELQAQLQAANGAGIQAEGAGDVVDFKDMAAEDTRAQVDEVANAHAARELGLIAAALRRVATLATIAGCRMTVRF